MTFRVVAFDLESASLASLREALPTWTIEEFSEVRAMNLRREWSVETSDFVLIEMRGDAEETLALCRLLVDRGICSTEAWKRNEMAALRKRSQPRIDVPLLVLVPEFKKQLVPSLLEAGAHSCLMLPINAKEVASMLKHVRAGNQAGRHTSCLEGAQLIDRWRDEGGEG